MRASSPFSEVLDGLNPEQREAATATAGNVFISAGAGTGKTKTLTAHYVACLLAAEDEQREGGVVAGILAITYTKAAAAELADRIRGTLREIGRDDLAREMGDAWISTIHSFCQRILRAESLELSGEDVTDPSFATLEPLEAYSLRAQAIDEVLRRWAVVHPDLLKVVLSEKSRAAAVNTISTIVNERGVWGYQSGQVRGSATLPETPDNGSGPRPSLPWQERAAAISEAIVDMAEESHGRYREMKALRSALDYGDLITRVAGLFERNPRIAAKYREQFNRIIIDEFQDTNELQYSVFRAIARNNLSIVGDKNQSIYSFQGAQAEVFNRARQEVGYAESGFLLELGSNYRSHEDVLNFANVAFTSPTMFGDDGLVQLRHARDENRAGVDKLAGAKPPARVVIAPILGDNKKPKAEDSLSKMSAAQREAIWIADWVERLHRQQDPPVALADIKIVVRARTDAATYSAELRSRNIPAQVVGGKGLLNDPVVRAVLALVRVLDNPADEAALVQLMISPIGRVPDQELADLRLEPGATTASRTDAGTGEGGEECGLWSAVQRAVEGGAAGERLSGLFSAVCLARDSLGVLALDAVIKAVVAHSGVDLMLLSATDGHGRPDLDARQGFENLMEFIDLAGSWDRAGGSIRSFISEIEGYIGQRESMELPRWSDGSEGGDVVSILTVHATKGLEFPVVILPITSWTAGPKFEGACRIGHVERMGISADAPARELRVTTKVGLTAEELAVARKLQSERSPWISGVELSAESGSFTPAEYTELGELILKADLEEMRRLMYVAVTRARDMVIIGHRAPSKKGSGSHEAKKGVDLWAAMLRDRFVEGDYPDFRLKEGSSPFEVALDTSMLTHAHWASAVREGVLGYPPVESAWAAELLGEDLPEGDGRLTTENANNQCEETEKYADRELEGARHLELVPRRSVGLSELSQVSASHLSVYRSCPRQYYLQYLAGAGTLRNKDPNDSANRGNALHAIMERTVGGDSIDLGMAQCVLKSFRVDESFHGALVNQAQQLLDCESLGRLRAEGAEVRTERQFYEHIVGASGSVCLQGYIDVLARRRDGAVSILDYKSGKGSGRDRYEVQARCYALVALRGGGTEVEVRFLMPSADRADMSGSEDVLFDGEIPYYRFAYSTEDRPAIEAAILEAAHGMVKAGELSDAELEDSVAFGTCMYCGFPGPLCAVGAKRKRS